MSIASISYSSLKDASNEAKSVAKKLDKYADSLYDNVYKKLNKYDGIWTSNLSTAKSKTNDKISELRSEQSRYETYATDLIDLRDECKEVDKAVKSRVSSLTASFNDAHGIRNSKVENAISYFFTSLGNETAFGRWLGGKKDDFDSGMNYFKDSIKEWYNYEGGKELIKGMLVVVLEVAIAIAGAVVAVLTFIGGAITGGAILVLVAALVGAAIALQNALTNYENEKAGYAARQNNDPATGMRRSEINSYTDYLRSSYMFGDDGETYHYNKFYNGLAIGIDIVNLACTVVTVVSSAGKLLKNGFKWATGSNAKLSDIKISQVFSKDTLSAFKGKFIDIKEAFKMNGWQAAKDFGSQMFKDMGRNIKGEFFDFFETNGDFNMKGAISSIKNMISIPKDILSDGFNASNIFKVGLTSVVFPALTVFSVDSTDATIVTGEDGQLQWDFTEKITFSDFFSLGEKGWKLGSDLIKGMSSDSIVNVDVMDKLDGVSNIDISIPEVYIPNIEMPVIRAI